MHSLTACTMPVMFAGSAAIIGLTRWLGRSGIQTGPEVYGPGAACGEEE